MNYLFLNAVLAMSLVLNVYFARKLFHISNDNKFIEQEDDIDDFWNEYVRDNPEINEQTDIDYLEDYEENYGGNDERN